MKSLIFFSLLIIVSLSLTKLAAQAPPVLPMPSKYFLPVENISLDPSDDVRKGTSWRVFSDRDGNLSYTDVSRNTVKNQLNFLDQFWVIGESGDFLHIAKDENYNNLLGVLSNEYQDYGWIEKKYLLLWTQCIVSPGSKITKKAMVLNTIGSVSDIQPGKSINIVDFYKSPSLINKSDKQSNLFHVFFIFKQDENSYLLGQVSKISDPNKIQVDIWGWVPKGRVNVWDTRIAIEPNWDDEPVKERKAGNIRTSAFSNALAAKNFKKTKIIEDNSTCIWKDDPYEKRNIGDWRRFPLLRNDDNLFKIGLMGEINALNGGVLNQSDKANIDKTYNEKRQKMRNINIVFVVDGTESMGPYFQPIINAINIEINQLSETKNNIRFGAVVYRDYSEGEYLTETIKLTSKYKDVTSFLSNAYSPTKNLHDKDASEALYYGLLMALRNTDMPPDETNIFILVGDAGNHDRQDPSQVDRQTLVDLIIQKNVNILAFQASHKGVVDYDNFGIQVNNIMLLAARAIHEQNKDIRKVTNINYAEPVFVDSANTKKLNNSAIFAKIILASSGMSRSPNSLQQELEKTVEYSILNTEKKINALDNTIMNGQSITNSLNHRANPDEFVNTYEPAILNFLQQLNIPPDKLSIMCSEKYQFYTPAYTPNLLDGNQFALYKSVLFMTRLELGDMISDILRISNAGSGNEARINMYNTWLSLLKQHLGEERVEQLANAPMTDIVEKVFDLPSKSEFIKNVRLQDITDPVAMPDRQFEEWVAQIDKKYHLLLRIFNSDLYEYSFRSNDQVYYWMDQNLLP